jgi:hypothetical protein
MSVSSIEPKGRDRSATVETVITQVTIEMVEAGANVARELIDYEWAAISPPQQQRILSAIYLAMSAASAPARTSERSSPRP